MMNLRDLTPWRSRSSDLEHPVTAMHREMDRLFSNFFDHSHLPAVFSSQALSIDLDVSETDDTVTVKADLPGLEEKEIDVTIDNGVLTIKGERNSEHEEKDEKTKVHLVERAYGSFQRSLSLPSAIDETKVKATFDKGVLEIVVPKKAEAKRTARKVEVKSA